MAGRVWRRGAWRGGRREREFFARPPRRWRSVLIFGLSHMPNEKTDSSSRVSRWACGRGQRTSNTEASHRGAQGGLTSREAVEKGYGVVLPLTAAALAEGLPHVATEVLRLRLVGIGGSKGGPLGRHFHASLPRPGAVFRLVAVHGVPQLAALA